MLFSPACTYNPPPKETSSNLRGATSREVFKKYWYKASNCDSITDERVSATAIDDANAFALIVFDFASAYDALFATVI